MKLLAGVLLTSATLALPAGAAVESIMLHITTNSPYTVPAGKVLILENIKRLNTFSTYNTAASASGC